MNEQMIQLTGNGFEIAATKEAEKLKLSLIKEASTIKVCEDKADEALALAVCAKLGAFRRQLDATEKAVAAPLIALRRRVAAIAEQFGEDVEADEKRIKGILGGYQMKLEQERRRIEEEARRKQIEAEKALAAAESARIAAEKKNSAMAEAKAERMEEKAIEARVEVMQLEQQAAVTKVKGGRVEWDFEIEDIDALYNEEPSLVKLEPKTREIKEFLKRLEAQGKPVAIHGLRTFQKPVINVR